MVVTNEDGKYGILTDTFTINTFSIDRITPDNGLNTSSITVTISGSEFLDGSTVKLTKLGYNDIQATNVSVNSTTIICSLNLFGVATGQWNVEITTGTLRAILPNGFTVKTFVITEVSPNWGDNRSEAIVSIKGSDFVSGSTVKLTKNNEEDIIGKNVFFFPDHKTINCVFDLRKKSPGLWNVVVSTGQVSFTLSASFLIYTKPAEVSESSNVVTGFLTDPSREITITVPTGSELEGMEIIISSGSFLSNINITIIISVNLVINPPSLPSGIGRVGKVVDFSPGGLTFENKATLKIPYRDSDLERYGISDPELLKVYYYNPWTEKWEELGDKSVDTVSKLVVVQVDHFSFYTLGVKLATSNTGVRIYPNPWRPGCGDIWFSQLVPGSEVKIYTLTGELVRELEDMNNLGRISWDTLNSRGEKVASGIYICIISGGTSLVSKKIAVIR